MSAVWPKALDVPPNAPATLAGLVALAGLVDEVERLIKLTAGDDSEAYLEGFGNIRNAIDPTYWNSTRDQVSGPNITNELLARLKFCHLKLRDEY